jgi:hypothetical protein
VAGPESPNGKPPGGCSHRGLSVAPACLVARWVTGRFPTVTVHEGSTNCQILNTYNPTIAAIQPLRAHEHRRHHG